MAVTLENFRLLFTEFADVADEVVQLYLNMAVDVMTSSPCLALATMLRAAHEMKMMIDPDSDAGAGVGAVSSASDGALSVSFNGASWADSEDGSWFSKTKYGQRYMSEISRCGRSRVVC